MGNKVVWVSCLLVLISTSLVQAEGWLDNPCYLVTDKGELQRLSNNSLCSDNGSKYDKNSASGDLDSGGRYAVEVKKDGDSIKTLEAYQVSSANSPSSRFPLLSAVTSRGKQVQDKTICSRSPFKAQVGADGISSKRDSMVCVTITAKLCELYNGELNKTEKVADFMPANIPKISPEEIKKCIGVVGMSQILISSALSKSWKDSSYSTLAKQKLSELQKFSEKLMETSSPGSTSYQLIDSNPQNGTSLIENLGHGIRLTTAIIQGCDQFFPLSGKSSSGAATAPSSEQVK